MAKKKAKEQTVKSGDKFIALVGLTSDSVGKEFEVGDKITAGGDFPIKVIENWLKIDPPAVKMEA